MLPIAVLASGSGSNLQALLDAASVSGAEFTVQVVVSDRPSVRALDRAGIAGAATVVVPWSDFDHRDDFSEAICDVADRHGAETLVLAGFMRILAPVAIQRFPGRILNIHPSLLPAFPGAHAVPQALAHGVRLSGVTVHFVDEEVDHGPIIWQTPVPVLAGDDEGSLHARIQAEEHRLYPLVVEALAAGRLRVEGRHVHWDGATP